MMKAIPAYLFLLFPFLGWTSELVHWPDKHGPTYDGIVPVQHCQGLPMQWSETENVVWKSEIKGFGHSTPVIHGDKIWLTSATKDGKEQFLNVYDRPSGKLIIHRALFINKNPESLGNPLNTYATPSPVADEDSIYVHFGTYGTARLNSQTAEVIWERRDINVKHFRGPGSSPILYNDKLILTFDGIDAQFVTGLDKKTGKSLWKTHRSVDFKDLVNGKPKMDGDLRKAFGTPSFGKVNGKTQLFSVGSRAAYGYDIETGDEIWILEHKNYNAAVAPVYMPEKEILLVNTGSSRAVLNALRMNGRTKGNVLDQVIWSERNSSAYCKALIVGEYLYELGHRGKLNCIHIDSGERKWSHSLKSSFLSSPVLINKNILVIDDRGKSTIFKANPEQFEMIAENIIADGVLANPIVVEGELYLRSKSFLYKIKSRP